MRKPFTLPKLGLTALSLLPLTALHAQSLAPEQALEHALAVRAEWAGPGYPAADLRVSSAYADANGLEHIYMQQLNRGIPVYNRIQSLAFAKGRLASHAGSFVPAKQLAALPATPSISAATAVSRALQHLNAARTAAPARLTEEGGPEARQTFAAAGVARRDIVASLTWALDDAAKPHLTWNVNIDLLGLPDWWNVRVDALTGAIVNQDNWTVSEAAAHRATTARTATARGAARRTAAPAAFLPPTTTSSTYLVVPYPRENPGTLGFQTDVDPWLKAGATNNAVTHGWNFDGTTNYANTRGNNVAAYDDVANTNAPGSYAPSQTPAPALSFNYVPDFTTSPGTATNRNAAVVNLFYWNNIVHDIAYQYGFTEVAGNFQTDNLSRGGRGADHVRAEAQDGGGTNNANFSTPPDGTSGRMQMYLWSPIAVPYSIQVTAPSTVAGSYSAVESIFSTNNKLATLGPIAGQLGLFTDAGSSPVTNLGCGTHSGPALTGKIAVVYRGVCGFTVKVKNAQLAGAIAAIVINNAAGPATAMGGTDNTITIPAVMLSQADGARLVAQIASGVQVTLPRAISGPQLDGDLDNGIVVHEYGHGVSNRLTGGPAASSCLGNAEQGGEGWSDYLGLMMNTDWSNTPLSAGPAPRAIGNYADGQPATGSGIRRYPYSTSITTNPLTYANLTANPESHAIGEIWCAALWDMTWSIIQQRGVIEPNFYNGASTGGNVVAMQLVMQGMKLQPCQPGFLDARDAILAADSHLYQGQYHCTIWRSFARRGMGYSAVQGLSTSATDQVAAYDMPPAVSLQKTSSLVSGNTFDVAINLTCNCQLPTTPYTLTDELPTGMQFVSSSTGGTLIGNKVTFANVAFTSPGQKRTLRFLAQATAAAACAIATPVDDNRDARTTGGFTPQAVLGTSNWAASTTRPYSGTQAWAAPAPATPTDFTLTSAPFTPTGLSVLSFYHYFNFEGGYDGGMVELSTDNGASWQNTAAFFVQNGYNSTFDASTAAPGAPCFSGNSGKGAPSYIRSVLDLRSFAGVPLRMRFRVLTDDGTGAEGWYVDDIQVLNGCGGNQRIELLSGATVQDSQNIITYLVPAVATGTQKGLAQASLFTAQPNPFGTQGLRLAMTLPTAQAQVSLTLLDVTGRVLLRRTVARAAGTSTLSWPETANLPAGLYLMRAQLPDGSSTTLRVERE